MANHDTEAAPQRSQQVGRLRPYQTVGDRYLIGELLARGGFGEVYTAAHPKVPLMVCAVKVLQAERDTPSTRDALLEEGRMMRDLPKHPAFIELYDAGVDPATGIAFLAMEYLRGRTLRDDLNGREHPLGIEDVLTVGMLLSDALGELHDRGYCHADVTPNNVWLVTPTVSMSGKEIERANLKKLAPAPNNVVGMKLIDVGAAVSLTRPGSEVRGLGTPGYLAPERHRGGGGERGGGGGGGGNGAVVPASDLFALGTILYELLTLEHPFHRRAPTSAPRSPRLVAPDIPASFEAALLALLDLDPARRPQSGRDAFTRLAETAYDVARASSGDTEFPITLRPDVAVRSLSGAAAATTTNEMPRVKRSPGT